MKVEPGNILKLFLNFSNFEPQYSYRLYSYKNKSVIQASKEMPNIWKKFSSFLNDEIAFCISWLRELDGPQVNSCAELVIFWTKLNHYIFKRVGGTYPSYPVRGGRSYNNSSFTCGDTEPGTRRCCETIIMMLTDLLQNWLIHWLKNLCKTV